MISNRGLRRIVVQCGVVLSLFVLTPSVVAAKGGLMLSNLHCKLLEKLYVVDAKADYRLSDQALEALQNGVPLSFDLEVSMRRVGAWIWEEDTLHAHLRYQIRYHALASLYQVIDLQREHQQSFATKDAALEALGDFRVLPLIQKEKLDTNYSYRVKMRLSLDIDALPLPLRPMAYISPSWNLSSNWSTCLIQP